MEDGAQSTDARRDSRKRAGSSSPRLSREDRDLASRAEVDVLNSDDDNERTESEVTSLLEAMSQAAREDRDLLAAQSSSSSLSSSSLGNQSSFRSGGQSSVVAASKLRLLPRVQRVCEQRSLHAELIAQGFLSSMKEWLLPLDRANTILPLLSVRTTLLDILASFAFENEVGGEQSVLERVGVSVEDLAQAGLGRALMLLLHHPKETEENKRKIRRIKDRIEAMMRARVRLGEKKDDDDDGGDGRKRKRVRQATRDDLESAEARGERSVREFLKRKAQAAEDGAVDAGAGFPGKKEDRIPKPAAFDYPANVPSGNFGSGKAETGFGTVLPTKYTNEAAKQLLRHVREKSKTSKPFMHAEQVSLQGRPSVK